MIKLIKQILIGKNKGEECQAFGNFTVGATVKSTFGNSWGKTGKITRIFDNDPNCYSIALELSIDIYVDFGNGAAVIVPMDYLERIA